jgi:hypothetical protein
MKDNKQITFHLFRYQIVPITKEIPANLFEDNIVSIDDLIKKKNEIFENIIQSIIKNIKTKKNEVLIKSLNSDNHVYLIKLGVKKDIHRFNKDFKEENIENYPNILIYINNNPNVQEIVIQKNTSAFSSTYSVVNMLDDNINEKIKNFNLAVYINPIFEEKEFWDIVRHHEKSITQIQFELIKPNMSNISATLTQELKDLQNNTNSHKTKLELNAPKEKSLDNIKESNQEIENLVNYSSLGGGDITLRAKGIRNKIKIGKQTQKEISIDEIEITGNNPQRIINAINGINDNELF